MIGHKVLLNVIAYIPEYGQSDYGFSIRRSPSIFMYVAMWKHRILLLTVRFLVLAKFTTLTPSSLLISHSLFPIVGLKISSIPTLTRKSPKKNSYRM
jgi:hypothetical protein